MYKLIGVKIIKDKNMYLSIYISIYANLPWITHPRSGDSQGQKTVLAPSTDKQTCNYDTEYSNHYPSQSP